MSKWKQEKWLKKVSEIYNKDLIDADQVDTLNLMIKSSDSENFTMAEETIKVLIRTKLSQGLNQGQVKVFEEVIDYLENPEHQALVLKGYAGTGKTFLIKRILEYIVFSTDNKRIAIGAPTNKAVSVIYKNSMSAGLNGYVFESLFDTII
jgi:RecG-like helicase